MSTRVLPAGGFFNFNRMSELSRRFQPPVPTTQPEVSSQSGIESSQSNVQSRGVRRNLFGPINHDENKKFVQEELAKIAAADQRRWNFNFQEEKPLEGRFSWLTPKSGQVPIAYEMPNLTAKLTQPDPCPTTAKITNVLSATEFQQNSTSSVSTAKPSTSASGTQHVSLEATLKTVSTASGTVPSVKQKLTSEISCPSSQIKLSKESKMSVLLEPTTQGQKKCISSIRPEIKQTKITEFLKVGKRSHSQTAESKIENEEVVPPALKRARTST